MRYILYLLVAANLVFLGWNLAHRNARSVTAAAALPPLPASVKRLVTLQENRQHSDRTGAAGVSGSPSAAMAAAADKGGVDQPAPVVTGAQTASGSAPQQAVTTTTGESLDQLTAAAPPGAGEPVAAGCQELGPFAQEQEMRTVAGRLEQLGVQSGSRQTEVREESGYWVYLPSMSQEAAQETARRLDERGDKDYFIGRQNYISLGIFEDKERAEGRVDEMRKLGLDAVLKLRYQTRRTWWLAFAGTAGASRAVNAILTSHPGLQLHDLHGCNFAVGLLE